jgi:HSP20 family protein
MLTRWFDIDPISDMTSLRSAMDRLLEQAVVRPGTSLSLGAGVFTPPMNVYEQDSQYIVQVYLPGVDPQQVQLTVRNGTVTLKGRWPTFAADEQKAKVTWLLQEFGGGEFTRSLTLPKQVATDDVHAHYDQGILTIRLPLAAHEQAKSIAIRAASIQSPAKTVEANASAPRPELVDTGNR